MQNTLIESYKDNWKQTLGSSSGNICESGKLSLYKEIKSVFGYERYLGEVKNQAHRKAMTKIRLSCHRLQIESGRYTVPKTPREQRFCTKCKAQNTIHLDDEINFLLHCPILNDLRSTLMDIVNSYCKNFNHLTDLNKVIYLLNSEGDVCRAVAKFCHDGLQLKGS